MYIYRSKNIGRPGVLLAVVPLVILALLLAACGSNSAAAKSTPTPTLAPDQGLQLLEKAGQSLNGARTLHALLDISISGSAFNGTINAEVWNEQPNKNRSVVQQSTLAQLPAGELSVSNGKQIWEYDPAKKVVYTAKMNGTTPNAGQDSSQFLLNLVHSVFSGSPASLTTTSTTLKGRAVYDIHVTQSTRINGTGSQGGTQFSYTGDIYLDKTTTLPVEIVLTIQGFGQVTIDLPTLDINPSLSEQLFTFTPPAGVKVLPFPPDTGATGSLTLAEAQQQAGYHLLSIPTSQTAYALQSVDALGAPGNQIYTLNYLYNGSSMFTISESKALANLPASGQPVKVRGTTGSISTAGSITTLAWTEHGVGIQIIGALSNAQLMTIAGLLV